MAISRQKEARSRDYALLLFQMTSRVLYSARYHRQHCTFHAFEQFGALYMHNHDDKYQARPGFEPGTSRLQTPVDTNEPSGPATNKAGTCVWHSLTWRGPGSDTHWHDGDLGLILADRAGTCVMTGRGPGSDTHWHGGDWVPAPSVSVRPRSPPCQWVSPPGPHPVSECQTQVPALSVSVRPRSPLCQWVSDPGTRPVSGRPRCQTGHYNIPPGWSIVILTSQSTRDGDVRLFWKLFSCVSIKSSKVKRLYLPTCKVSRYGILALHGRIVSMTTGASDRSVKWIGRDRSRPIHDVIHIQVALTHDSREFNVPMYNKIHAIWSV